MSIEEKTKAYDEALEKARLVLQERGDEPDGASILSELFPELAESEDEKIRKALIKLVKKAGEGYENVSEGVSIQKAISWLKKQGEQKPADNVEPKFKVGDIVTPKDGGHEPWQIMQVDILDKKYRFKDGYVIHF